MKLKKMHWVGIIAAAVLIFGDVIFFYGNQRIFLFLIGIALGSAALPFIVQLSLDNREEQKINEMFLEFARNLAESVSTGTPISRAIVNMKKKNYAILNPYVNKLANQIEIGVPIEIALKNFAEDLDSSVVKRATALINEAERSGGEIDYILESTASSISEVEKLKKERKAAIYNLIVQGYIIFFIFIGIILVMEFKIIPLTEGIGDFGSINVANPSSLTASSAQTSSSGGSFDADSLSAPLLYLLLTQGLFMGLVIGKLTEGSLKKGIKHSLTLVITALLVSGSARLFFQAG